jgi:F420-non-reducing hydrogenase iron-sulfur subunit
MNNRSLKIYFFYCSNSIDDNILSSYLGEKQSNDFKMVSLPCSGKIDILYLLKAFETGADGVVLVTCPEGDCLSLEGNMRARKRSQAVDSLLEEIGIDSGRMAVVTMKDDNTEHAIREIENFIDRVRDLPALLKSTSHA